MDIINHITKLICALDSLPVFIAIVFILLLFKKHHLFFTTSIILTSSSLINCVLKLTFKVPLLPHLGFGYAFPSGHTQMATVFLGWLCIHHILKKTYFITIILAIGISIYMQNYHTPIEIIGGFFSGLGVLMFFYQTPILKYPSVIFAINSLMILWIWSMHYFIDFFLPVYIINMTLLIIYKIYLFKRDKQL